MPICWIHMGVVTQNTRPFSSSMKREAPYGGRQWTHATTTEACAGLHVFWIITQKFLGSPLCSDILRTKMKRKEEEGGAESDVDQDFLDRVLNNLYDFGDGAKGKRSKKKHKKRKTGNEEEEEEDVALEEEASNDETSSVNDKADIRHMNSANHNERIPKATSSESASQRASSSNVQIVTFQDPLKRSKSKKAVEPEAKPPEVKEKKKDPDDFLTIEKARLEVHRFGITGFQKQQQRVFEQDRAVMLGARPPKKDYVNYKVYQQMVKERKLKEKEEMKSDPQRKKGKAGKPGKQRTEKPKSSSSGGGLTGQVGRFKNGMLVLSNKDIQKLNVKVRK